MFVCAAAKCISILNAKNNVCLPKAWLLCSFVSLSCLPKLCLPFVRASSSYRVPLLVFSWLLYSADALFVFTKMLALIGFHYEHFD